MEGTKMYGKKQHRNIWDEDCLKNGINTSLTKVSNRLKEIPHFSDIGISLIVRDQFEEKKLVVRYLVKKLPSLNLSFIPHSKQLSTAMKKINIVISAYYGLHQNDEFFVVNQSHVILRRYDISLLFSDFKTVVSKYRIAAFLSFFVSINNHESFITVYESPGWIHRGSKIWIFSPKQCRFFPFIVNASAGILRKTEIIDNVESCMVLMIKLYGFNDQCF